jgi:NADH dehydrogenase
VVDLSRVPGMPEHAFLMKNVGDALKLRATIIDRFEEANLESDPAERRRLLSFVIVGGGYSGVETAGQINDLGEEILSFYPRLVRDEFRVVLIHSQAHLLPEISEALGRYCEEHLLSRSVELILNARVTAITAGRVLLGDGREIESHTVVSTVGNAPHPLLTGLCKAGSFDCAKGRIICDQTMRVAGQEHLWAVGDCAAIPMPRPPSSSPTDPHTYCPPNAQFASRQGKLLGENLSRVLDRSREPKPFTFTSLGELASIGHHALWRYHGSALLRLPRVVCLADDLPVQAARPRAEAAGDDRLDARPFLPARHHALSIEADATPAGDPPRAG